MSSADPLDFHARPHDGNCAGGVKDGNPANLLLGLPAYRRCIAEGRDGGADTLPPLGRNAARVHRQRGVFGGTDDSAGSDAHGEP